MTNFAEEILKKTRVQVSLETYFLVSMKHDEWRKLLETPELAPRMTAPFMIFSDKYEVTLLLDDIDYGTMRHAIREAKKQGNFRMLTFDLVMDFDVVGFMALVSKILAEANISIIALSAFSRDHILVSQDDLPKALKVLGPFVDELC
jgi:hypothetical protein